MEYDDSGGGRDVDLTGEINNTCKNFTTSALLSLFLMMTDIVGEVTWIFWSVAVLIFSIISLFSIISTK